MSGAPGRLFVCGTPIGNLGDAAPRLLDTLRAVPLIAAEDTRHTRKLLTRFDIHTRLVSYHQHNERGRLAELLDHLRGGQDLALVSDAGTPGVSDPGLHLVDAALAAGLPVVAVPGPSAVTTALACSGFPADRFVFDGFVPRGGAERRARLQEWARETRTVVCFEAPSRVAATLAALAELAPDRLVVVARELTKVHEEFWRGTAREAAAAFAAREARGEFTLVLAPVVVPVAAPVEADVDAALQALLGAGMGVKEASARVAERHGLARREAYRRALRIAGGET